MAIRLGELITFLSLLGLATLSAYTLALRNHNKRLRDKKDTEEDEL